MGDGESATSIPDGVREIDADVPRLIAELEARLAAEGVDPDAISTTAGDLLDEAAALTAALRRAGERAETEAIRDIAESAVDLRELTVERDKIRFAIDVLERLSDCETAFEAREKADSKGDRLGSMRALSTLIEICGDPTVNALGVDLFATLKTDALARRERLLDDLSECWNSKVSWKESSESSLERTIALEIRVDEIEPGDLEALSATGRIRIEMENFAGALLKRVLLPVIRERTEIEIVGKELRLAIRDSGGSGREYSDVLGDLRTVFEFLSSNSPTEPTGGDGFLGSIGSVIGVEFGDALVEDCLVRTIPNSMSELRNYAEVTDLVERFQRYLTEIGFFERENRSLLRYANDIDALFADRTSRYFLESARKIMKKDLGNVMSVGTDGLPAEGDGRRELFARSPFAIPRCAISRSCRELLDLVVAMMEQASLGSEACSRRLYFTARNIFELYVAVVPSHFRDSLENLPQEVAVFHNNCMYLSHGLLTLGEEWTTHRPDAEYPVTFCDQVKQLRDLGAHTLLEFMRNQKNQLLSYIRNSDLYHIGSKDSLDENAEKCIRQCLRQLQLLNTVWTGVFPSGIYKNLISMLANTFVEELISRVLSQEDITAKAATQLTQIYEIVLQRLPQIYREPEEIESSVSSWRKLKELVMILSGSLAFIEERWFSGMGPLALYFKPEELKHLIRALFQNTAIRANLLSKIK